MAGNRISESKRKLLSSSLLVIYIIITTIYIGITYHHYYDISMLQCTCLYIHIDTYGMVV